MSVISRRSFIALGAGTAAAAALAGCAVGIRLRPAFGMAPPPRAGSC